MQAQALDKMQQNSKKAESLLKTIANSKRLMILCHLTNQELNVTELTEAVGLSQSALSQHLAKMRNEGVIESEKRGQMVYYRLANPEVSAILSTLYLIYCK